MPRRPLITEVVTEFVYALDRIRGRDPARPAHVKFQETGEAVDLAAVPQPFGGLRWYFVCPCGRRCEFLYLHEGSFRCRTCHHLAYPSQNATRRRR
jgi:hypothetical protein